MPFTPKLTYKGKPLVRKDNELYYGRMTAPCDVTVLTAEENRTVLEFVLHEGRNRQIRRMCEAVDLEVIRLKRIAVGSLKLGMLPVGKWRELTDNEVQKLMRSGALQTEDTKK